MAKKEVWDFECPQYVDFERELDNTGKDDIFFDIKGKSLENKNLHTPEIEGKSKGLTESDENRLLDKMSAALSFLENTPKIKKSASRGKLFESTSKDTRSRIMKSAAKPNTVPAPLPKSRMSKSLDSLNKIISGKTIKKKMCGLRKSSSLNDLRTHNKFKYPITPMCLKRTIFKAKEKIIKTTEEMELEHIAVLQKQLIQHLRQNEISLKRLNLRPRQGTVSKTLPKPDNLKTVKGVSTVAEKSAVTEKEPRRNIRTLSQAAVKKEASKLDTIIKNENAANRETENAICSRKSKAHSVSINGADAKLPVIDQEGCSKEVVSNQKTIYSRKTKTFSLSTVDLDVNKSIVQRTRKTAHSRILDHSGLIFVPSIKSNTTVRPFIFEAKTKEMKPQFASARRKETSAVNLKENDKENKGCIRSQFSAKKTGGKQNGECDISKLAELNKTAEKRAANPLRGVPLAENVTRN